MYLSFPLIRTAFIARALALVRVHCTSRHAYLSFHNINLQANGIRIIISHIPYIRFESIFVGESPNVLRVEHIQIQDSHCFRFEAYHTTHYIYMFTNTTAPDKISNFDCKIYFELAARVSFTLHTIHPLCIADCINFLYLPFPLVSSAATVRSLVSIRFTATVIVFALVRVNSTSRSAHTCIFAQSILSVRIIHLHGIVLSFEIRILL